MIRLILLMLSLGAAVLLLRSVRILLLITGILVIAASGFHPQMREAAVYPRFIMYAALIAGFLAVSRSRPVPSERLIPFGLLALLALGSVLWAGPSTGVSLERAVGLALLFSVCAVAFRRRWTSGSVIGTDLRVLSSLVAVAILVGFALVVVNRPAAYFDFIYTGGTRLSGSFENPNTLGLIAALYAPVFLGLAYLRRRTGWWKVSFLAAGAAVVLSQSRSALLALVVGLSVFVLARQRLERRRQLAALLVLGCVLFPVAAWFVLGGDLGIFQRLAAEGAGSGRFSAWTLAVDIYAERPITGWGFGSTEDVFGPRAAPLAATNDFVGLHPHNTWLMALIEVGPLGMLLLVGCVVSAVSSLRSAPYSFTKAALLGALAAGISSSFLEAGLTSPGSVLGFNFWILGFMGMSLRYADAGESVDVEAPPQAREQVLQEA